MMVFLKKDNDRFFLRNGEITVDAGTGNVVIPNMNIRVIFPAKQIYPQILSVL